MSKRQYRHAALGGTFDRFHRGHESLLFKALNIADLVTVGITTPKLVQAKELAEIILPYQERLRSVSHFLQEHNAQRRVDFTELHDIYGPTLSETTIDALVVTDHTWEGAQAINTMRVKVNASALPIVRAQLIKDESGHYISSTLIRQGKINRMGQVYLSIFKNDIKITQEQKQILQYPQGVLIREPYEIVMGLVKQSTRVALVGDYISQWFVANSIAFNYAVVDGFSQRKPFSFRHPSWIPDEEFVATNPAGSITAEAAVAVEQTLTHNSAKLMIKGEEDLIAVVLVLLMPLNSVIFYGQPDGGVVALEVSEQTKAHFARFMVRDW